MNYGKVYRGMWSKGERVIFVNDDLLDPRLYPYVYVGEEPFAWSVNGKATDRLAFAILHDYTQNPVIARVMFHDFKWCFLAHAKAEGFQVNASEIDEFLAARQKGDKHVSEAI